MHNPARSLWCARTALRTTQRASVIHLAHIRGTAKTGRKGGGFSFQIFCWLVRPRGHPRPDRSAASSKPLWPLPGRHEAALAAPGVALASALSLSGQLSLGPDPRPPARPGHHTDYRFPGRGEGEGSFLGPHTNILTAKDASKGMSPEIVDMHFFSYKNNSF